MKRVLALTITVVAVSFSVVSSTAVSSESSPAATSCSAPAAAPAAPAANATSAGNTASAAEPEAVFYLVVYRPGPAWPQGAPLSKLDLKAHGRYMVDLYARGVLDRAGGFTNDSGGAMVLRVPDEAAARAIVAADPAVTSTLFLSEVYPWRQVNWQRHLDRRMKAVGGS